MVATTILHLVDQDYIWTPSLLTKHSVVYTLGRHLTTSAVKRNSQHSFTLVYQHGTDAPTRRKKPVIRFRTTGVNQLRLSSFLSVRQIHCIRCFHYIIWLLMFLTQLSLELCVRHSCEAVPVTTRHAYWGFLRNGSFDKSNENFKTTIPSKNYDRPKTTRECGIF